MPLDAMTTRPTDAELLFAAKCLIDHPNRWIKHQYQTQPGFDITQYCARGALAAACGNQDYRHPTQRERRLARLLVREMTSWVPTWLMPSLLRVVIYNDSGRTAHVHIMSLFDRAIARQTKVKSFAYAGR